MPHPVDPADDPHPVRVVSPSREDPVVRAASEVVGGPAGTRLRPGRTGSWSAAPVVVLFVTATVGLAVVLRQHCRATLWASPDQFTHACYSDVPALFASSGVGQGVIPYLQAVDGQYLAQPAGTGVLLWLLGLLTPDGPNQLRWAFDLGVVLITLALIATVLAVLHLSGRRPWDAALVALSPLLLTAALISLDVVAVALAVLGVLAFSRHRPVAAGVLVGLAVTVRPTGIVVIVALLLLAARSGRWQHALETTGSAVVVAVAANLPFLVANPAGWRAYWASLADTAAGYGSLWFVPHLAATAPGPGTPGVGRLAHTLLGHPAPPGTVRALVVLGAVLVLVGVGAWVLTARRRPRLPAVVLVLLVGWFLVAPVVPIQASLWVLPFAALAVPRWAPLLGWAAAEALYATVTWLYLYGLSEPSRGAPAWMYGLVLVVRLAAMAWLAVLAVRANRDVWRDPVRAPLDAPGLGRDDPAAGPIEGAPDAGRVRLRVPAGGD